MESSFRFYFKYNKRRKERQWVDVHLWDVHPTTFADWGGGNWAYFLAEWSNPRQGFFGTLHMVKSRIRFDGVNHELLHIAAELMWVNGETITRKNEERMTELFDRISGSFRRELRKAEPKINL